MKLRTYSVYENSGSRMTDSEHAGSLTTIIRIWLWCVPSGLVGRPTPHAGQMVVIRLNWSRSAATDRCSPVPVPFQASNPPDSVPTADSGVTSPKAWYGAAPNCDKFISPVWRMVHSSTGKCNVLCRNQVFSREMLAAVQINSINQCTCNLDAENYSSSHIVLSVASKVKVNFRFPSQLSGIVPTEIKL